MNFVNQLTPFLIGAVGTVVCVWALLNWYEHRRTRQWQLYQVKRQKEIEEAVDAWHADPRNVPLHEHLGMTPEQYAQWLKDPDTVDMEEISGCRKSGK